MKIFGLGIVIGLSVTHGGSCAKITGLEVGSGESHFLRRCQSSCPGDFVCSCGVCTSTCAKDSQCLSLSDSATCLAVSEDLADVCADGEAPANVCDVECSSDSDCADLSPGHLCDGGRCRLDALTMGTESNVPDGQVSGCQLDSDCGEGMRCGFPTAQGCAAVGECLPIGVDGDVNVYATDCAAPTPGLTFCSCADGTPSCFVRTVTSADGQSGSFTHAAAPTTSCASSLLPTDESGLVCAKEPRCDSSTFAALPVRLSAAELGGSVTFLEAAAEYVLAESTTYPEGFVVRLQSAGTSPSYQQLALPANSASPSMQAIALDASGVRTTVLQCAGVRCAVSEITAGLSAFSLVAEFSLDDLGESSLAGVFAPIETANCAEQYDFCVYGGGLHCFQGGSWKTEIALTAAQVIRAVDTEFGCRPEIAVGDGGLVMRYDGTWKTLASGTTADLLTVGLRAGRFTASATTGEVVEGNAFGIMSCNMGAAAPRWLERLDNNYNCSLPDQSGIDTVAADRGFDTHITGITADGRLVMTAANDSSCPAPELWSCGDPMGGVVGFGVELCGASQNPVVVTASAVLGESACVLIP